jgi:hypothetical protein
MSTKNLSRTIIEGGRHSSNKWDRRHSHAEERAAVKNYMSEVLHDPDNYDEYDVEPIQHVYKAFDDKLGPIYRWLNRQVGRPWDEVYADVTKTFDTRTTAGRHIVYDHLLDAVEITPEVRKHYHYNPDDPTTSYYKHDYYVDDGGILQKKRYIKRSWHEPVPEFNTKQIANWLNGRVVGKVGNKFLWFVPATKNKKGGYSHIWGTEWHGGSYYADPGPMFLYLAYEPVYKEDSKGRAIIGDDGKMIVINRVSKWVRASTPTLRQDRKLSPKELDYWNSLPEYYQRKILEKSPGYPKPAKTQRYYY